ncbi:MAG TPA: NlpC/P60 family protein [Kiloniellales bacterium]
MTTRSDVIAAARAYVGRPFRWGGRSARGLDCVGLPLMVARDLKVAGWEKLWNDPECHAYARVRAPGFLRAKLDTFCQEGVLVRIDRDRLQAGDLVLRFGGFGHDHHVSILAGEGTMIEARSPRGTAASGDRGANGKVIETLLTPLERRTFMGGYQFLSVI